MNPNVTAHPGASPGGDRSRSGRDDRTAPPAAEAARKYASATCENRSAARSFSPAWTLIWRQARTSSFSALPAAADRARQCGARTPDAGRRLHHDRRQGDRNAQQFGTRRLMRTMGVMFQNSASSIPWPCGRTSLLPWCPSGASRPSGPRPSRSRTRRRRPHFRCRRFAAERASGGRQGRARVSRSIPWSCPSCTSRTPMK